MPNKRIPKQRVAASRKPAASGATQGDGPSSRGQVVVRFTLPGTSGLLVNTVTTGVLANSQALDTTNITGFATRFGSTFDEYRILGVNVKIRPVSSTSGVSHFFFDEKSSAAPTVNECYERIHLVLPNTNATPKSFTSYSWRARDLLDLEYRAIGTTYQPVYFKTYTDTANFGAPAVATPLWYYEYDTIVEFRGLKST